MSRNNRKLSPYERAIMMLKIAQTAGKNPRFREKVQKMLEENYKLTDKKTLTVAEKLAKMPILEDIEKMYLIRKNMKLRAEKETTQVINKNFYKNNNGITLPIEVSNDIVKIIKKAYKGGKTAEIAIKEAIDYIKFTHEYKLLSEKQKLEVNADLVIDVVTHNLAKD